MVGKPLAQIPGAPGIRRALLIGIDSYPNFYPASQLHGCVNDILQIRAFLVSQAGFPAENINLLLAPGAQDQIPGDLGPAHLPTAQAIRDALTALGQQSGPGDEVVIYYSGHGVRLSNPNAADEQIGAIAPMDVGTEGANYTKLVVNRALNRAIHDIPPEATVTVVLDSCHSGGATRDLDASPVRELRLPPPTPAQWAALQTSQGATAATADVDAPGRELGPSAWLTLAADDNLIVLAGCHDDQRSREYPPGTPTNGALTYFLLQALKAVPAAQVGQTRWADIYGQVRQAVQRNCSDQVPTLEGRAERPLFGGAWTPYDPGYTVTPVAGGLTLDAGRAVGLDVGAQVAIYPPGTPDFVAADRAGMQVTKAAVDGATLTGSHAQIIGPAGPAVAPESRARLIRPSSRTPPLAVLLTALPDAGAAAVAAAPEADAFLTLLRQLDAGQPQFEVRPWAGNEGGWVLVPYRSTVIEPTSDDVIAYLPPIAAAGNNGALLGTALGNGLVQWARYWNVLNLRHDDPTLGHSVDVTLLAGSDYEALYNNPDDPAVARAVLPTGGEYAVTTGDFLLLKVAVRGGSPYSLGISVLVCSNDGNIRQLSPPPGDSPDILARGDAKIIGANGMQPIRFSATSTRADQSSSLFTFKIFANDAAHLTNTESMTQLKTVQQVIDGTLNPTRGDWETPAAPAAGLWTTRDLPVRVRRLAAQQI